MTHDLKTWKAYFYRVQSGEKNFELRKNDRDFQSGDTVRLHCWDEVLGNYVKEYEVITRRIGYILHAEDMGLQKGYVIFSLEDWIPIK